MQVSDLLMYLKYVHKDREDITDNIDGLPPDFVNVMLRARNRRLNFTALLKTHFKMDSITTDVEAITLLQRHCKKITSSMTGREQKRRQTFETKMSDKHFAFCPAHLRGLLLGAVQEGKLYCQICETQVRSSHFKEAHLLLQHPQGLLAPPEEEETPHEDELCPQSPQENEISPEEIFVHPTGEVYHKVVEVLALIIDTPTYLDCVRCISRNNISVGATQSDFNRDLLDHLPQPTGISESRKYKKSRTLEEYISVVLVNQTSVDLLGMLEQPGAEIAQKTLRKLRIMISTEKAGCHEFFMLRKQAENKGNEIELFESLQDKVLAESRMGILHRRRRILNKFRISVLNTAIELKRKNDSQSNLVLVTDSVTESEHEIPSTNETAIAIGFRLCLPAAKHYIGSYYISGSVKHIMFQDVGLYRNELTYGVGAGELTNLLAILEEHVIFVEIDPYQENEIDLDYIRRQILLIKKIFEESPNPLPPVMVLSGPTKEMIESFSEEQLTNLQQRAEMLAVTEAYKQDAIIAPLGSSFFPCLKNGRDVRRSKTAILQRNGKVTEEGAKLLRRTMWRYTKDIARYVHDTRLEFYIFF